MGSYTSAPINRLEASFYAIQSIKALAKHEDRLKNEKCRQMKLNSTKYRLLCNFPWALNGVTL